MTGVGAALDLQAFAGLYTECQTMDPRDSAVLLRTVNDLVNDPQCVVNTSQIISVDAANAPCTVDEEEQCESIIATGAFTCETDYCATCEQAHACDNSCGLPCVGQEGGTLVGVGQTPLEVCETNTEGDICDVLIGAGAYTCASDYCLTCA